MPDDRLIVALDVPNAVEGLALADRLGDAVSFYKIGLGMLTGGGLALAMELKDERGKRVFLDMKLFDIGATVEAAVRGLAQFDLDFLTVHGDPHVVRAAREGAAGSGLRILAVTILTSLDRRDLDAALIREGAVSTGGGARRPCLRGRGSWRHRFAPGGGADPCAARGVGAPYRDAGCPPSGSDPRRPETHRDARGGHRGRRRPCGDRSTDSPRARPACCRGGGGGRDVAAGLR